MNKKLKLEELNRITIEAFKQEQKFPLTLVLDNIRSGYNIGAVFRTCDALAMEQVILCGITAQPPHREIRKTALGASESVRWSYAEDTIEAIVALKKQGYTILALEQVTDSVSLLDFAPEADQKYALVVGNEVEGVKQEVIDLADVCLEIPQFGTKHSLNVSVSAGIAMWDIFSKTKKA